MEVAQCSLGWCLVNRGEPAIRLNPGSSELNEQRGCSIRVIGVAHSRGAKALFVQAADESVCVEETISSGGVSLGHSELERALQASGADAVWVGGGSMGEDPAFRGAV